MTGHQDPLRGHCPASPPAWPSVQMLPGGRGPQQLPELRCFAVLEEEAVLKALSTARAEEASGPGETLPGGCVGHVTTHGRPTRQGAHEFREIPEVPRDHLPTHPARGVFSGRPRQPVKWWIPPGQRARQQPLWAWQAHLSAHPR